MNNRPGNIWNPAALKRKMPFRYSRIMVFSLWTAFPVLLTAFLSGCAVSKTLPEGTFLYAGSELELKHPDSVSVKQLKPELESLFSPRTNRQLLGYPVRLHFYNLFASEKEKGLFPWLQRILGEPPVLFDEKIPLSVEPLLENRAFNLGYLHPEVQSRLDTGKHDKLTVN